MILLVVAVQMDQVCQWVAQEAGVWTLLNHQDLVFIESTEKKWALNHTEKAQQSENSTIFSSSVEPMAGMKSRWSSAEGVSWRAASPTDLEGMQLDRIRSGTGDRGGGQTGAIESLSSVPKPVVLADWSKRPL